MYNVCENRLLAILLYCLAGVVHSKVVLRRKKVMSSAVQCVVQHAN